jgi:hypothetical protein
MIARMLVVIVGLFCLHPIAYAVLNVTYIEQEVVQNLAGQPKTKTIQRIWYTDTMLRFETTSGKQSSISIFDVKADRVYLMPTEEKQYLEVKINDYRRIVAMQMASAGLGGEKSQPKLTKTDEEKKIGDWQCRKIVFEQGGELSVKSELWVTKDINMDFKAYLVLMKRIGIEKMLGRLTEYATAIDGYPVQVNTEQVVNRQHITSRTRVIKITVSPTDQSLFSVPAGYKRMSDTLSESK